MVGRDTLDVAIEVRILKGECIFLRKGVYNANKRLSNCIIRCFDCTW